MAELPGVPMMIGGLNPEIPANSDTQAIADLVKQIVEKRMNTQLTKYEAKSYCTQLVSGTNYFIKICVSSEDTCIHVRIYFPLACSGQYPSVTGIQKGKKLSDPLEYFESSAGTSGLEVQASTCFERIG